jgi:hypothetical protein
VRFSASTLAAPAGLEIARLNLLPAVGLCDYAPDRRNIGGRFLCINTSGNDL